MIRRLFYLVLVVLLAPLFFAFTYEGAIYLASVFTIDATKWFLIGAAVALPLSFWLLSRHNRFLEHLLHELEHASINFVFTFHWPRRMEIDPEQGSNVQYAPARGGCLRTLAPYYFPLLTIPFLLIKALAALVFSLLNVPFPAFLAAALDFLIGATLMVHTVSTFREFRLHQTDISGTGLIPSLVGVLFASFMFLLISLTVVIGSYAEFVEYLKSAAAATVDAYQAAFDFLVDSVLPFLEGLFQTITGQS